MIKYNKIKFFKLICANMINLTQMWIKKISVEEAYTEVTFFRAPVAANTIHPQKVTSCINLHVKFP